MVFTQLIQDNDDIQYWPFCMHSLCAHLMAAQPTGAFCPWWAYIIWSRLMAFFPHSFGPKSGWQMLILSYQLIWFAWSSSGPERTKNICQVSGFCGMALMAMGLLLSWSLLSAKLALDTWTFHHRHVSVLQARQCHFIPCWVPRHREVLTDVSCWHSWIS